MTTERPCRKNYKELSPDPAPQEMTIDPNTPKISMGTRTSGGWSWKERTLTFSFPGLASCKPCISAARDMWDGAKVSGHVASQTSIWPFFQSITEIQSSRLFLEHAMPVGSGGGLSWGQRCISGVSALALLAAETLQYNALYVFLIVLVKTLVNFETVLVAYSYHQER